MTRLWIVRHGNTFAPDEAPRRVGARTDLPLVESGRTQAARLCARFAAEGLRFDRVLASPLLRSRETARLIVGGDTTIEVAALLDEIDHGPDEDKPEHEVIARIGYEALKRWDEEAIAPPDWQVDREARIAGWKSMLETAEGDLLLVTSNGAARFALFADSELVEQAAALSGLKLRTGAWGLLVRHVERWSLVEWDVRP